MRILAWIGILLMVVVIGCGGDDGVGLTNRGPNMSAQADTSVSPGDTLVLWAKATDPNGDPISFGLTVFVTPAEIRLGDVPNTTFESSTGRFEFRPVAGDRPSRDFAFTAADGNGGAGSTEFTITVN